MPSAKGFVFNAVTGERLRRILDTSILRYRLVRQHKMLLLAERLIFALMRAAEAGGIRDRDADTRHEIAASSDLRARSRGPPHSHGCGSAVAPCLSEKTPQARALDKIQPTATQ